MNIAAGLLSGLGIGSGVNSAQLVDDLANAARAPKEAALRQREAGVSARISALSAMQSSLRALADATEDAATRAIPDGSDAAAHYRTVMTDFVAAFNNMTAAMRKTIMPATPGNGDAAPLVGVGAARDLMRQLGALNGHSLTADGPINRLAAVGIRTARDGSLVIDKAKLATISAEDLARLIKGSGDPNGPAPGGTTGGTTGGLTGVLRAMADRANDGRSGLSAALTRARGEQAQIAKARSRIVDQDAQLRQTLGRSFGGMDRQIAAAKAVQSYLTQQFSTWKEQ